MEKKITYKKYSSDGSLVECYYGDMLFALVSKVSQSNWRGNLTTDPNYVLTRSTRSELIHELLKECLSK
ncbi:hypothetical protein BC351_00780 [Paenibacillus ferrarius]|uniref:Uncharacterized protein n=1 Tax=Paenibacillus ferrarius TaxID=1469647 RepID=A0A1V4HSP5_9BACL|nr:hypothetical protein BC351_00780 [Paenibacillus ferrarius]